MADNMVGMGQIALVIGIVIVVAGSSYGVSRMMVNDAVAEAKPLADQRNAQRAKIQEAEQQQMRVAARQDTLTKLLLRLEEKLHQSPADSMLLISAGNVAYDLQEYNKAERHYKSFLDKYSNGQTAVKIDYGFTVFQTGKQDQGIKILRNVLDNDRNNQTALFNLAYMYQQQGKADSTRELLTRCRDANPTSDIGKNAAGVLQQLSTSATANNQ